MRASSELTSSAGATAPITAAQMPPASPGDPPPERRDDRDRGSPREHRHETRSAAGLVETTATSALEQVEERRSAVVADHGEHRAQRALHRQRGEGLVSPERLVAEQRDPGQPARRRVISQILPAYPRIIGTHDRSRSGSVASDAVSRSARTAGWGTTSNATGVAARIGGDDVCGGGECARPRLPRCRRATARRSASTPPGCRRRASARRSWAPGPRRETGRPSRRSCRG